MTRAMDRDGWGKAVFFSRWLWGVLSAFIIFLVIILFGFSLWLLVLIILLPLFLIAITWAYILSLQPLPVPLGAEPETRGVTHNWLAPYYDGLCGMCGIGKSFHNRILAISALQPGEHVLDAGCGTGALTRQAAAIVGRNGLAWGIDPAPDMIRVAQQRPGSAANTAQFRMAAIENLPFEAGSFDVVIINLLLHCLPLDVKQFGLRAVHKILRPGGRIIVADFDLPRNPVMRFLVRRVLRHPFMTEHLEGRTVDLLRDAGFVQINATTLSYGLFTCWTAKRVQ